ncbi:putative fad-binding domain containing protein [Ilyonectria robusta]
MANDSPILIIGAGVVGLALAQGLKKEGIPFRIFERDEHIDARGHGWAITLWVFEALDACLPASMIGRLGATEVDPTSARRKLAKFCYLNLADGSKLFDIEVPRQRRINREKFRKLMLDGIDVEWNKQISGVQVLESGVRATFLDGTSAEGIMVIGADGATSMTRRLLCPDSGDLEQLPVRFMGVTIRLTPEQIAPLRAVDPMLFQGTHPETNTFLWYSLLDTPEVNGSTGKNEYYDCQLNISWPYNGPEDELPATNKERVVKMKELAQPYKAEFRQAFMYIPDDAEVTEIKLRDWRHMQWPSHNGRTTLIGDAAHAMVMYRGEAANHGVTDAHLLRDLLAEHYRSLSTDQIVPLDNVIQRYEEEMKDRAGWSVRKSRGACLDAHEWSKINPESDLFAFRAQSKLNGHSSRLLLIEGDFRDQTFIEMLRDFAPSHPDGLADVVLFATLHHSLRPMQSPSAASLALSIECFISIFSALGTDDTTRQVRSTHVPAVRSDVCH